MNESSITRVLAIVWALCVIPGCYLSHGLDASTMDAGSDGSTRDESFSPDGNVDARFFDASVRDVNPARDGGVDSAPPFDAGVVDPPPPGVRAVQLAAGREHVCALGDDGNVYCWGSNVIGQSAAGELRRLVSPTRVSGLPPIASIHTMDIHTCAVDLEGGLWCWGFSAYGQLIVDDSEIPECGRAECSRIPLEAPVTQTDLAFIARHGTCTRDMFGEVRCWGDDRTLRDVPTRDLMGAETLDFGLLHGCALDSAGVVRCFGESEFGRIGDREDGIIDVDEVTALEVGGDHSCVLTAAGEVLCWGYDWAGALGVPKSDLPNCVHGDRGGDCSAIPIAPIYVPAAQALSIGAHRTCAIARAGGVGCWGAWTVNSGVGWCGSNVEECDSFYTEVEGTSDAVAIEVGGSVACIIDGEGAVHCWGWGEEGQLGHGRLVEGLTAVPVRVLGFGE